MALPTEVLLQLNTLALAHRKASVPILSSVIDTPRTDLGVTRQGCHYIHEMIVTANRTCVLLASEDMITQRINALIARAKRGDVILI